ncbi:hypothetical protein LBMAG56_09100 [Verrucomicrobiota bacterium]|nr:hypothetical protein LBMAG56_09100 [Verrucomicrobiota bacterium]
MAKPARAGRGLATGAAGGGVAAPRATNRMLLVTAAVVAVVAGVGIGAGVPDWAGAPATPASRESEEKSQRDEVIRCASKESFPRHVNDCAPARGVYAAETSA